MEGVAEMDMQILLLLYLQVLERAPIAFIKYPNLLPFQYICTASRLSIASQ